jgi:hypothetical protein
MCISPSLEAQLLLGQVGVGKFFARRDPIHYFCSIIFVCTGTVRAAGMGIYIRGGIAAECMRLRQFISPRHSLLYSVTARGRRAPTGKACCWCIHLSTWLHMAMYSWPQHGYLYMAIYGYIWRRPPGSQEAHDVAIRGERLAHVRAARMVASHSDGHLHIMAILV